MRWIRHHQNANRCGRSISYTRRCVECPDSSLTGGTKAACFLDMTRGVCVRVLLAAVVIACSRAESVPAQTDGPATPFANSRDAAVRLAATALASGRGWRATEILDSAYRDLSARTPEVVLLIATASAAWGGWARVDRELSTVPWLDTLF